MDDRNNEHEKGPDELQVLKGNTEKARTEMIFSIKNAWKRKEKWKAYVYGITQQIIKEQVHQISKIEQVTAQEACDRFKSELNMGDVQAIINEVFDRLDAMIAGTGLKKDTPDGKRGLDAIEEEIRSRREDSKKGGKHIGQALATVG